GKHANQSNQSNQQSRQQQSSQQQAQQQQQAQAQAQEQARRDQQRQREQQQAQYNDMPTQGLAAGGNGYDSNSKVPQASPNFREEAERIVADE
ncbi:UNVERIFIED_CONTAM: hypothetical protein NY603_23440, partial [Bacteroidetes bacterium 56_B9]